MPTFEAYEAAVINSLKSVPGIKDVKELFESLSPAALKKVAPRDATILFVPLGGMPDSEQPGTGQLAFVCRAGAFIVTRNARGSVERMIEARELARKVMLTIWNNQWQLPDTYPAIIEKLENRSSGKADDTGYAIWLVIFKQTIYLDELPADDSIVPTGVWLGRSPDIGTGHEPDYTNIEDLQQ